MKFGDRNLIIPYLAPLILLLVVINHFILTQTSHLSPWKGGGFGMFATVDSPGARFLRIYLLTNDETIPIVIPKKFRKYSQEIRTIPVHLKTENLAKELSKRTWVELKMTSAEQRYKELLHDNDQKNNNNTTVSFNKYNFVRMIDDDKKAKLDDVIINVQRVKIEVWKYNFNRKSLELNADKYLEVIYDTQEIKDD